jgi:hypothetical protein
MDAHKDFINLNKRGFGYWLWKPYLVLHTLHNINDDDIIIYADAGCEFNKKYKNRLMDYIDIVNNSDYGILSFQMQYEEKVWTKMDTALAIYKPTDFHLLNTGQLYGGIFLLRKCPHSLFLVKLWYELSCNYHLIDDSPSVAPNNKTFIEHRHDQSIFSLLRKKYGTSILPNETCEYYRRPITSSRNKNYENKYI